MTAQTDLPRPRVVLCTTASVDGRVTTSPAERLLDPEVRTRWQSAWPSDVPLLLERRHRWIQERYAPTVTLEGSGTFVAPDAVSPWAGPPADGAADTGRRDHLPCRAPRWFVVVDGRGRVEWEFTGDDETALLVLVCGATPTGYLRRLRELGIGYLLAGEDRVDLGLALRRLQDVLGARTVVADGGGGLHGALLRLGLVDELHTVVFPALVGGLTTPSFVDGPPLEPGGKPVRLRVRSAESGPDGSTWTRYDVERDGPEVSRAGG